MPTATPPPTTEKKSSDQKTSFAAEHLPQVTKAATCEGMQGDDVSLASSHVYENGNLLPKITVVMSPVWSSTQIATTSTWLDAHAFGKNELAIDEWYFVKRDILGPV